MLIKRSIVKSNIMYSMMHRTILTHIINIDAPNRLIPMLLLTPKLVLQIDNGALLVGKHL